MNKNKENTPRQENVSKNSISEFEELVKREKEAKFHPDEFWMRHHDSGAYL